MQMEWIKWCKDRSIMAGYIVHADMYLNKAVVAYGNRKTVDEEVQQLSKEGVEKYVNAVVNIWRT